MDNSSHPDASHRLQIVMADFTKPRDITALRELMQMYATDPLGGGEPLSADVLERLPETLSKRSGAYTFLAYVDGEAAGIINTFEGFSTFKCAPLLNIHDVAVVPRWRGHRFDNTTIVDHLFMRVEAKARDLGCCKMTLEVLDNNERAKRAYARCGFAAYELDPAAGKAQFWQKPL